MRRRAVQIAAVVATASVLVGVAPIQAAEPDWQRALRIRSEALNRAYGLGDDEWRRALRIRSEELNRTAHGSP